MPSGWCRCFRKCSPAAAPILILVGVGPGSFTGIRVGVAAAHGLAIGWDAQVRGLSSLALLAASSGRDGPVTAAVIGGHGELFVQDFAGGDAAGPLINAVPADAAARTSAPLAVGSGAAPLIEARGNGEALAAWPSARFALALDASFARPRPHSALRPRARRESLHQGESRGLMASPAPVPELKLDRGTGDDLDSVMAVMKAAFGDTYGEAWTRSQCAGIMPMRGILLTLARDPAGLGVVGFSLARSAADECELLLIAVDPAHHRRGIGALAARPLHGRGGSRRRGPRPPRGARRQSGDRAVPRRGLRPGRPAQGLLQGQGRRQA